MLSPTLRSVVLLCQIGLVLSLSATGHHPIGAETQFPPAQTQKGAGQSRTLLADGSVLLIGGEDQRTLVQLVDASGAVRTLPASPTTGRAWHTATLLADGSVLVLGGTDAAGRLLSAPERFVPATLTFESLPAAGLAARARHTATILSDGRVLVVGGAAEGVRDDAEIWDPVQETARPLNAGTTVARRGHAAALLDDGRVLITGGNTDSASEVFDPSAGVFAALTDLTEEPRTFRVAWSSPTVGGELPIGGRVALRLSQRADIQTMHKAAIRLVGPDGELAVTAIPVEGGRLVFVTPQQSLQTASEYMLTVQGIASQQGLSLQPFHLRFRTERRTDDVSAAEPDDEAWHPGTGTGNGRWRANRPPSPWQSLPPLQAPPGTTAVAGQALRLNGRPLADVTLRIGQRSTRTDRTGRFLLLLGAGGRGRAELEIDGSTASAPGRRYGFFEVGVPVAAGQTNVLPYTIWMPRIDTRHGVRIASPTRSEVVVTTPLIPGLELRLPRGTVIRDHDGRVVRELSITPIPVDRPPFPLPEGIEVPIYFTVQPGGSYVYVQASGGPRGARLIYPNYQNTPSGIIANFWHYDPEEKGWYVYGAGSVRGRQIVPDPGVAVYEFTGAMVNTGQTPPPDGPTPDGGVSGGDPVDLGTGLLIVQKTDLALPDVLPLSLTRTYRPGDAAVRPFGIGSTHDYAMFLWSAHQYTEVDLILPTGARVHYVRTSPGTGFVDAVFEHTASPTIFYKSVITWNGRGWDLRLRNGTVLVFGENAPLQAIHDRFGNSIILRWSSTNSFGSGTGRITSVSAPNGRWIAFAYDTSDRIVQATDNTGRAVSYQYDSNGRLWKVTDAASGVTEYTYDSAHRMLTIKDPRGVVYLTNEYDANGRVIRQTQADTSTFEFAYTLDGSGNVTRTDLTDPLGRVTRVEFNAHRYPASITEAFGTSLARTTTLARTTSSDHLTSITDALSRQTSFTYDSKGNLASTTLLAGTPDAVTSEWTYDSPYSQLTSVTDPLGHTTTYTLDELGRVSTITDALNHQYTITYNPAGQPVTLTNSLSETVQLEYSRGALVGVTSPEGLTHRSDFDAAGRLIRSTDPQGATAHYSYNALNLLTAVVDPYGNQTSFTYDGNGNLLTLTDARNKITTWTYDVMDRVATRTDPLSRTESFDYDFNGNLIEWTDRKGQVTTYHYDALDRQTLVGFGTTAGPTYASSITRTYDAGDRALQIADSVGGTIERTFDLLDRLTEETTPEGSITYTYDSASRRTAMQVAGQPQVSYTYDNADRLTAVTQGSASVTIAYDAADRRTSLTLPNGIVVEYAYDSDSRLTGLTYKNGSTPIGDLAYTYDAAGQRTSVGGTWARTNLPAALASATYDDANQIVTFGGVSFTYDVNGNLTSDGVRSYAWNARNELASLTGPVSATFAYDGVGRRRAKTIGGTTTQFLYDGLNPVQELSGGSPVANLLTGLGIDEYFTRTDGGGVREFLTDALGSSIALTDGSGTVQTEYRYEPFGGTATSGSGTDSAFGFTGREADGSGLYYFRARYYHPRAQRFIGEDLLGFGGGDTNLHAYVGNSPTNFVDPTGEIAPWALACLGGAAFDAGWYTATHGRKSTWGGAAAAAGAGCGAGLAGFGAGKALGAAASWAASAAARAGASAAAAAAAKGPQFSTAHTLASHYAKHASEWGGRFKNAIDYLLGAQNLLRRPNVLRHTRANGDTLFYDAASNEFAVQAVNGTIRTYFRPVNGYTYWLSQIGW